MKLGRIYGKAKYMATKTGYDLGIGRSAKDLPALNAYRNSMAGQRCFIMGNGPSLRQIDLDRLEHENVFVFNGAYDLVEKHNFQKPLHVVEDHLVLQDHCGPLSQIAHPLFLAHDIMQYAQGDNAISTFMQRTYTFDETWPGLCDFDQPKPVFRWGGTVAYFALQLACFMGFKDIYFIGMDLTYKVPETVIRNGTQLTSVEADPNHYRDDYFGPGKSWHVPEADRMLSAFQYASTQTLPSQVHNASVGGRLDCFPRVDFESLF